MKIHPFLKFYTRMTYIGILSVCCISGLVLFPFFILGFVFNSALEIDNTDILKQIEEYKKC